MTTPAPLPRSYLDAASPDTSAAPARRLIRFDEVMHITGISRPRIYALIAAGRFPKQVKLGSMSVAFVEAEVRQWIAARIAERDNPKAA